MKDRKPERVLHCWADRNSQYEIGSNEWAETLEHGATCLLEKGHDGPHEWTPDEDIKVTFAQ